MTDDAPDAGPWTVGNVVLDCPEPRVLAEFYRALLGWEYLPGHESDDPDGDEWLVLEAPDGLRMALQQVPDFTPASWPGPERPPRMHLDIPVTDLERAHARAVAAGARPLTGPPEPSDDMFRVYADPAGHPFCLCLKPARPA